MRQGRRAESLNSPYETLGAMDLAGAIGAAQPEDAAAVQELGVRLVQMRGLLHCNQPNAAVDHSTAVVHSPEGPTAPRAHACLPFRPVELAAFALVERPRPE